MPSHNYPLPRHRIVNSVAKNSEEACLSCFQDRNLNLFIGGVCISNQQLQALILLLRRPWKLDAIANSECGLDASNAADDFGSDQSLRSVCTTQVPYDAASKLC